MTTRKTPEVTFTEPVDVDAVEAREAVSEAPEPVVALPTVDDRLNAIESRLEALTAGVNQFGFMLQHIVDSVTGAAQAIQSQGLGGIMALMGGKKSDG